MSWFDTYTRAAHRAVTLPDGWTAFSLKAIEGQGVLVTGKVVTRAISRGPSKGQPDWRTADTKTTRMVFVSNDDADAERQREIAERSAW